MLCRCPKSALASLSAVIAGARLDASATAQPRSIIMSEPIEGQETLVVKVENLADKEYDRQNQEMKVALRAPPANCSRRNRRCPARLSRPFAILFP